MGEIFMIIFDGKLEDLIRMIFMVVFGTLEEIFGVDQWRAFFAHVTGGDETI